MSLARTLRKNIQKNADAIPHPQAGPWCKRCKLWPGLTFMKGKNRVWTCEKCKQRWEQHEIPRTAFVSEGTGETNDSTNDGPQATGDQEPVPSEPAAVADA